MIEVPRSSGTPHVSRKGSPAPAEVLFRRGVGSASVAASGDGVASRRIALPSDGGASADQLTPVRQVLRQCSGVDEFNGSVASEFVPVASASKCVASELMSVASASRSIAYPSARHETPASTLPLVLRSIRRRAAAAKVLRGRRRLQDAAVLCQSDQVASESSPRALFAAVVSRLLALRGVQLRPVAFQSVASELSPSRQSVAPRKPRIVH